MTRLWDDARVATMLRPVDRTLNVLKFALVPAVALSLSLTAIAPVFDPSTGTSENLIIGLAGPIVAAIYLVLLQTEAAGSRIDKAFARLRRWVALACNHDYAATHERGGIACRLTPDIFQAPLFRYGRQKELVEDLTKACAQEPTGGYWFVEGRSGSGKTRAALRLVQWLVRDGRLFELGTRCYLYDFSRSRVMQRKLLRSLRSPRHVGAVILVDNFQLVESEILNELTDLLLEGSAARAQLVVFLARPRAAWNLSPGTDVRLLSEAKAAGRHFELHGALTATVEEKVSRVDPHVSELVGALQDSKYASALQMQLAQVIARTESVPKDVLTILSLLGVEEAEGTGPRVELVSLLGILTALSVHRGSFSRRDLRKAIRAVGRTHGVLGAAGQMIRLYASLRKLRRMGLISKIDLEGPRLILHEAVAELCIDRLWEVTQFREALKAVGSRRLREARDGEEPVVAWQLAAEIGDQQAMLEEFEDALAVGANLEMAACLKRARTRYGDDFTGPTHLQLAILLDRIGAFVESRQTFADATVAEVEANSDLAVLLAVSRIEANHFRGYEADLAVLKEHQEPIVRVIGEYWEAHIETHKGHFDSDRLLGMANQMLHLIRRDSPFWQVHSLSRTYFDSLRSFYLSGRSDVRAIKLPPHGEINRYLQKKLPIFQAMTTLYSRAHVVGHVLLPRLALFGEQVDSEDAASAGLELSEPTVPELCQSMLSLYRQARDEFWQYGDREADYLQADVLNAEMIQPNASMDDEVLLNALNRYESYIVSNDFHSLDSYPHLYFLRWNVLKRQEVLLTSPDSAEADSYLSDAEGRLAKISELDAAAGNVYGQLRARWLDLLLNGLQGGFNLMELVGLHRQMVSHGYSIEARLLSHLLEREGKMKPSEVVQIIRFYPYVHQ